METATRLQAALGYSRAEDVVSDHERAGMWRAPATTPDQERSGEAYDHVLCDLHDCCDPATPTPELAAAGFETIDLASNDQLQACLAAVGAADRIDDDVATAIQQSLVGTRIELHDGSELQLDFVAGDGLFHRRAGPNGTDVNPSGIIGANGHDGAAGIHADQDVYGTPLRQTMNGGAPDLFRHQTPDGSNLDATTLLLNLWIPLQQVTRPLVLMDRRTLDQQRHQLRYGLPVTGFLDRDADQRINDIWTFLPDPDQRWYFRSAMGPDQGYLFDTLGTPHGSCVLPGEDVLERLGRELISACDALETGDTNTWRSMADPTPTELPELTTNPIRATWRILTELRAEVGASVDVGPWCVNARAAVDTIIRRSVELRLVATLHRGSDASCTADKTNP